MEKELQTIISFMGWDNMPKAIAEDAVRTMVRNQICLDADTVGETCSFDEELECLALMAENNNLYEPWTALFVDDYQSLHDKELEEQALMSRVEIEELMMQGIKFKDAKDMVFNREYYTGPQNW